MKKAKAGVFLMEVHPLSKRYFLLSLIGRYERDEMKPSIDVVKKLAEELGTTVGYLLGEAKEAQLLKDPVMLKRF